MKAKILFVTPEAYPLVKTGGLGDVGASLPHALRRLDYDVRLLLPAYDDARANAGSLTTVAEIPLPRIGGKATLLEGVMPATGVPVWLVDYAPAFGRPGHPYLDADGKPWYDNAARFGLFAQIAVAIALDQAGLSWVPDVVHCHDWQTGLIPPLLTTAPARPATVFTIHNLAYQGVFPAATFQSLGLPAGLWSIGGVEFYGSLSFLKGGIANADRINTVSPTYAAEIQTPELGYGLDGLLRFRAARLSGILNGIDDDVWNPARDPLIARRYQAQRFDDKRVNKEALQTAMKLPRRPAALLFGLIGRLVEQKGIDLLLDAWPTLAGADVQLVVLGTGERRYETALAALAADDPGRVAVRIGYDEALAHQIEAGADAFVMPSRFEPCGLNQMYSLRYGTVPIVHRAGGLADTVVDATRETLAAGTATGIVFAPAAADALVAAMRRAVDLYRDRATWRTLALTGMQQDFSWERSARAYGELYRLAQLDRG